MDFEISFMEASTIIIDRKERLAMLSKRDRKIVLMLASGYNRSEIARSIKLSKPTTRKIIQELADKYSINQ